MTHTSARRWGVPLLGWRTIYDAQPPQDVYECLVDDFEGGRANSIQPYPWQTDTCIGHWHYYRGIKYRTADSVVKELVDIVSKNGNLLLNIPVRGDGSIDEDELRFLAELTKWMDVNSEMPPAIFALYARAMFCTQP